MHGHVNPPRATWTRDASDEHSPQAASYICANIFARQPSRARLLHHQTRDGCVQETNLELPKSPLREFPLNEPTYLRVKRAIIGDLVSGHFTPGMHLTIDALTSRYGVSHMPIREALRQLEGEGILISIVHRGFQDRGHHRGLYPQHLRHPGRDRVDAGPSCGGEGHGWRHRNAAPDA